RLTTPVATSSHTPPLFVYCSAPPLPLHSFPTRRSSDLAPVLLEEHPQTLLGALQIRLGVHRPQQRVAGDARVEVVHEGPEGLVTADGIVEAGLGGHALLRRGQACVVTSMKRGTANSRPERPKPARKRPRSSRSTPHCSPGAVRTITRRWYRLPSMDSMPEMLTGPCRMSLQSGSAAISAVTDSSTSVTLSSSASASMSSTTTALEKPRE